METEMTKIEADELLEQIAKQEAVIKAYETNRDDFVAHYEEKISHAKEICDKATQEARTEIALLTERLRRFAELHVTDKKRSVALPSGTMSFRKQQPKIFDDKLKEVNGYNEWLIEFVRQVAPDMLKIKVTESVDWLQFKSKLTIDGDTVSFADTGEIITGLHAQQLPDKFKIELLQAGGSVIKK